MTDVSSQTTTIEQTVRIAAAPETVWALWTEPRRLAEWWGAEAEVLAEPGGVYRVAMESGPVMRGTFIELDPPSRLVFSFGWEGNGPGEPLAPGSTRVEVTLTPDGGDTVLVLRHSGLPPAAAGEHGEGWRHFLADRLVVAARQG